MPEPERALLELMLFNPGWGSLVNNPGEYGRVMSETRDSFNKLNNRLKELKCEVFYIPALLPFGDGIAETIYAIGASKDLDKIIEEIDSVSRPYGLYMRRGGLSYASI